MSFSEVLLKVLQFAFFFQCQARFTARWKENSLPEHTNVETFFFGRQRNLKSIKTEPAEHKTQDRHKESEPEQIMKLS